MLFFDMGKEVALQCKKYNAMYEEIELNIGSGYRNTWKEFSSSFVATNHIDGDVVISFSLLGL